MPSPSSSTVSPGSTSRMNVAPRWSKAHVSEAKQKPPSRRARDSGRMPSGSRPAACNNFDGGLPLHGHGTDKDEISPRQIFLSKLLHIGIHQTLSPFGR